MVETKYGLDFSDGVLKAIDGGNVVAAGSEAVAGVKAEADGKLDAVFGKFAQCSQLFEAAAELSAGADRIFEQEVKVFAAEAMRSFLEALDKGTETFLDRLALVISGMHDKILGTNSDGTFDLASECRDGGGTDCRFARREVDEIAIVDHQRREIVLFASSFEEFDIGRIRLARAPLPRAGREDLKAVRADLLGLQG